jgi:hypothetical protein
MQSEDQYLERTPDLVVKVRAMREAAEKEMNRFTRVADYDVRRVLGQKLKAAPVSGETAPASPASERPKTSLEFTPAPGEHGDNGEGA